MGFEVHISFFSIMETLLNDTRLDAKCEDIPNIVGRPNLGREERASLRKTFFAKHPEGVELKKWEGFWNRKDCDKEEDYLFVFGENMMWAETDTVSRSTQAVIRGKPNAFGFCTCYGPGAGFRGDLSGYVATSIERDIDALISRLLAGEYKGVIMSSAGIGTGVAHLPYHIQAHLDEGLNALFRK